MSRSGKGMFDGFKSGDQVRVTLEGRLSIFTNQVFGACGLPPSYFVNGYQVLESDVQSVRLIEPEYEIGETYVDADGDVWRINYDRNGWYGFGTPFVVNWNRPKRPLRKLVPES